MQKSKSLFMNAVRGTNAPLEASKLKKSQIQEKIDYFVNNSKGSESVFVKPAVQRRVEDDTNEEFERQSQYVELLMLD